jgi:hypothetical protein
MLTWPVHVKFKNIKKKKKEKRKKKDLVRPSNLLVPNQFSKQRNTLSSPTTTASAISYFRSKRECSSNVGTNALTTKHT